MKRWKISVKIKAAINGPKKGVQEPNAIRDPNTNELIVSGDEIKSVTLKHCVDTLKNNKPDEEVKESIELKKKLHDLRMNEEDGDLNIDKEDFKGVLNKFKSKKTKSYDFLLKAGCKFQDSIFRFCKKMIEEEKFPDEFVLTLLHMIWKGKGPREMLGNNRFIHTKEYLPRTCEALVVSKMKEDILKASSIYQIGGQPGHSPEELLVCLKSVIARQESLKEGIIFFLVDIIKFFDKEDIYDVMQTLHEIQVNQKAARVWFKLNAGTRVKVKTAVGVSEAAEVGDCIGQGTSGGALVSQVNLDHGLQAYFSGSTDEYCYGSIRVQPLAYQDDVGRVSKSVSEARAGIVKVAAMLQDKGLQAHPDKTCFIVIGSKKFKESVARELEFSPLWFGNFKLKQKESDKYLGQIIHEDGLGRSAQATVEERQGKIKGATMEIKSLIVDFQMQAMGGLMTAWELWEKALIPSLLSGAGTWIGDISATVDLCDNLQNFFWRVILKVPESCPKMALRCETKQIGMKWRIWQEKIFLARRISKKEEDTLVKQVYTEGKMMGWPGLWTEVKEICKEIGIPDVNEVFVSSMEVKKAIFNHHLKHMRENMSKKLDDIRFDDFSSEQPYMNEKSVEVGRMAFKIRCKMVEDIPGNFKNKYRTKARGGDEGLVCDHCQEKVTMDQAHCMACPAWEDIREGLDMTNILHLVKFFQEMLKKVDNKKDKNKGSNRPAQHDSEDNS